VSGTVITYSIIGTMVVLFMTNLVPTAVTALLAALSLYATGVLDLDQALSGFGNPTVLFIASLLVVSASLDATGVTAWAGQALIARAGNSRARLVGFTALLGAVFTALIGVSASVAALMAVAILVAVRLGRSPSQLLMPLVFSAHAGSMLVLTASLVNLIVSNAGTGIGLPAFGFFELTVIGVPLAGTIAIVVRLGETLLPARSGRMIPDDLSRHASTLAEQYNLSDDLFQLQIRADSPCVGAPRAATGISAHPALTLIAIQGPNGGGSLQRSFLAPGDTLLVRGDAEEVSLTKGTFCSARRTREAISKLRCSMPPRVSPKWSFPPDLA
jgi:hypothetical protein